VSDPRYTSTASFEVNLLARGTGRFSARDLGVAILILQRRVRRRPTTECRASTGHAGDISNNFAVLEVRDLQVSLLSLRKSSAAIL